MRMQNRERTRGEKRETLTKANAENWKSKKRENNRESE